MTEQQVSNPMDGFTVADPVAELEEIKSQWHEVEAFAQDPDEARRRLEITHYFLDFIKNDAESLCLSDRGYLKLNSDPSVCKPELWNTMRQQGPWADCHDAEEAMSVLHELELAVMDAQRARSEAVEKCRVAGPVNGRRLLSILKVATINARAALEQIPAEVKKMDLPALNKAPAQAEVPGADVLAFVNAVAGAAKPVSKPRARRTKKGGA